MPTLYAMLVGISNYPKNVRQLHGCVNDVRAVQDFLQRYAADQGWNVQTKILLDQGATRCAIIEGFQQHFKQSTGGDYFFFYFSGHGSSSAAPDMFWNNPSGLNESILCYDSRSANGRDLMDKELSYLIWKASLQNPAHFLVMMDCCHAGSLTRNHNTSTEIERWQDPHLHPVRMEEYLGYDEYIFYGDQLKPPTGKHILLAGCRDKETSKEKPLGREYRGVFTYSLLEELTKGGIFSSYEELIHRAVLAVGFRTTQQTPQLELHGIPTHTGFLGNAPKHGLPMQVFFDRVEEEWLLDAGEMHNIWPSTSEMDTLLELEDGSIIKVVQTGPRQSWVNGMLGKNTGKIWRAWLRQTAHAPLVLCIDPQVPADLASNLKAEIATRPSLKLIDHPMRGELPKDATDFPQYCIGIIQQAPKALILTRFGEQNPVFQRVEFAGVEKAASFFLNNVETVAKWEQVLKLAPSSGQLPDNCIEIAFTTFTDPISYTALTDGITHINPTTPVELYYSRKDSRQSEPKYQVRFKNTLEGTPLWISVLLLGRDFSIDNKYLMKQELPPGKETWLTHQGPGPLHDFYAFIEREYQYQGMREIQEYIKVFISTVEPKTELLCQEGLLLDFQDIKRSERGSRAATLDIPEEAWMTRTVTIRIIKPSLGSR